jgi:hypothetical protein
VAPCSWPPLLHLRSLCVGCDLLPTLLQFSATVSAGLSRSVITDQLSQRITDMSARIEDNDTLWRNDKLRNAVLAGAIPRTLVALLGNLETVVSRLPGSPVQLWVLGGVGVWVRVGVWERLPPCP